MKAVSSLRGFYLQELGLLVAFVAIAIIGVFTVVAPELRDDTPKKEKSSLKQK